MKIATQNKIRHDRCIKEQDLLAGDQVLIRNLGVKGKTKLEDRSFRHYLGFPHIGSRWMDGRRNVRTLHRNHLLPIGQLVSVPESEPAREMATIPITRNQAVSHNYDNNRDMKMRVSLVMNLITGV